MSVFLFVLVNGFDGGFWDESKSRGYGFWVLDFLCVLSLFTDEGSMSYFLGCFFFVDPVSRKISMVLF